VRDRRAGRGKHEPGPAQTGIPRIAARELHAPRRGAALRRGDDGLSRRARRRAGSATASGPI
jgi:hypothetical protein